MSKCSITIKIMDRTDVSAYLRAFSSLVARSVSDITHTNERLLVQERLHIGKRTTCFLLYKAHRLVGAIHLYDMIIGQAYVYCWIHEHYWSRGIFSKAIRAIAQRVYRSLGIDRLLAIIAPNNIQSIRAFSRAGFAALAMTQKRYTMVLRIHQNFGL